MRSINKGSNKFREARYSSVLFRSHTSSSIRITKKKKKTSRVIIRWIEHVHEILMLEENVTKGGHITPSFLVFMRLKKWSRQEVMLFLLIY